MLTNKDKIDIAGKECTPKDLEILINEYRSVGRQKLHQVLESKLYDWVDPIINNLYNSYVYEIGLDFPKKAKNITLLLPYFKNMYQQIVQNLVNNFIVNIKIFFQQNRDSAKEILSCSIKEGLPKDKVMLFLDPLIQSAPQDQDARDLKDFIEKLSKPFTF